MTSSKPPNSRLHDPHYDKPAPVPPRGAPQSRFIPREELEGFAAWRPGSFGGGAAPMPHPADRPENKVHAAPPPPPAPPTEAEWMEAVHHARDSGYADGYRDGQVALEAFKESFAKQMAAQFGALLANLDDQWSGLENEMALAVTRTAVQLARQVVRHELDTRPEIVARVAQEAVGAIVLSARHLRVRLHPADHQHVLEGAGEALKARDAGLVADTSIEPGGCIVDSDLGQVDARIGTRWAAAAAVFGREDTWDAPEIIVGGVE
ncbi:MAG: FliH/SctL family protein [Betaproteobacteria bacterium]